MNKPNLFFPTPVWTMQLDNFKTINEEMYKFIKETQSKDQDGINKSNIKGWHSKDFDLKNNEPRNFITFISPAIEKVMIDMNWEKEKQKVNLIFLSSIFKFNKNYLGTHKFIKLKSFTNKKVVALGGISKDNFKKIKILNCYGVAGISYFEKKKAPKKGPF